MKHVLKIVTVSVISLGLISPMMAGAQTMMDTGAATGIGASIDAAPAGVAPSIRDRIRADIQSRMQNVQENQDYRNTLLENRLGTTTPPRPPMMNGQVRPPVPNGEKPKPAFASSTERRMASGTPPMMRPVGDGGLRNGRPDDEKNRPASSTGMMPRDPMKERLMQAGYTEDGRGMMLGQFKQRRDNAVKQLEMALNNLTSISTRIQTRIQAESSSSTIDMSSAISLLTTAKTKLDTASAAVQALKAYLPPPPSGSNNPPTAASSTVNLDTARQLMDAAKSAVKDAHQSLVDVVNAIAKAMGKKIGQNGNPPPRPDGAPAPLNQVRPQQNPPVAPNSNSDSTNQPINDNSQI